MFHASTCITSVAPSVARILGFAPPKCAGDGNPALDQLAADAFSGRKADRALLYNPDAIAHPPFAHYTDLFSARAAARAPLALPMQSVMPSVTPVCFASMYTGALPDVHGIQAYVKPVLTCDTLFDAAIRAGRKPAIVSTCGDSISKIFLDRPMDYFLYDTVEKSMLALRELICEDQYDLIVIYNGNYDATMHRFSPGSAGVAASAADNAAAFDRFARLVKQHWTQHDTLLAFCARPWLSPPSTAGWAVMG